MKISYSWLKDYVKVNKSSEDIAKALTDCGLEVEAIEEFESVKGSLKGVVIGQVKEKEKHPQADRLNLTKVDIGTGTLLKIVCGAPNVEVGQKVLVATIGTVIHSGDKPFTIKRSAIRGEESEGMLCAEDELGLGAGHDGILVLDPSAEIGLEAKYYFNLLQDEVFEIGITPNRSDATSHIGVARDLVAVLQTEEPVKLIKPSVENFKVDNTNLTIKVELKDNDACKRYSGVSISGIEINESPAWLKNRLKAIGLSPINNVVDITNYVLHETGQPLHAFDADLIEGKKIIVQKLPDNTPFITLDNAERKLSSNDLMICDEKKGLCIAGVFGGLHSGITANTKNIFIESAYFNPVSVRKTSKYHDLKTDSSFRFERGTDPNNTVNVLKRAALLIQEIAGGKISSEIVDCYPSPILPLELDITYSNVDKLIGKAINHDIIISILESLEITIIAKSEEGLRLSIPTFKVDVTREADVVEEILRIYGMNNIELPEKVQSCLSFVAQPDKEKLRNSISDFLTARQFREIMNNSLTKGDYYTDTETFNTSENVVILNPLSSELNVMRQTLLFGGLETISYNVNRQNPNLKFYEFGSTYQLINGNYTERERFALFLTGQKSSESWNADTKKADFFTLKGQVEAIFQRLGIKTTSLTTENFTTKIAGYGLLYKNGDAIVAGIASVSKTILKRFGIDQDVYYANLNWDQLIDLTSKKTSYKEVSKFPEVRRDLALLIDNNVEFATIKQLAFETERKILKRVNLFDVYQGDKISKEKKSYAVSFILQDEHKTLNDKEIDKTMEKLISTYKDKLNATLR